MTKKITGSEAARMYDALVAVGTRRAFDMARFLSNDRRPALNANVERIARFRSEFAAITSNAPACDGCGRVVSSITRQDGYGLCVDCMRECAQCPCGRDANPDIGICYDCAESLLA